MTDRPLPGCDFCFGRIRGYHPHTGATNQVVGPMRYVGGPADSQAFIYMRKDPPPLGCYTAVYHEPGDEHPDWARCDYSMRLMRSIAGYQWDGVQWNWLPNACMG